MVRSLFHAGTGKSGRSVDLHVRLKIGLCFVKEFSLSYIGMAAAIGQSINILIVIRRLAADWHQHVPRTHAGFLLDANFLRSLDAGMDHNDPAKVVKSYHHQWWTARTSPPMTDLLNAANIGVFLDHHRNLSGINMTVTDMIAFKPSYSWSQGITFQLVSSNIQCNECRLYCRISIGTLDDLRRPCLSPLYSIWTLSTAKSTQVHPNYL